MCVLLDTATYYIKQNHLLSRCILQDIKNILPLLAGTRILCLTVTNAFHKFQESCLPGGILLEDTGIFKHMAEHNTDLIPQNSLGFFTLQVGAVLFDQTIDPVSVYSQRAASFAAGVGGGTGQDIGNGGALIFQAGGQDGRPITSIRPIFSFLMLWYSLCGWKMPSGYCSVVRLLRSARSRM